MSARRQHNSRANNSNNTSGHLTKGQRKDNMARKKEERQQRAAHKKQKQAQAYLSDDDNLQAFNAQLMKMGLQLREIPGDGNCLFRALGDQLEGHGRSHLKHRRAVVKYMLDNRADFEPFVEDDVPFEKHLKNLNDIGTYAGNDAIVAFAKIYKLHVVIHQVNSPTWQIHGTDNPKAKELHISYHNGDHYSSIRKFGDSSESPANIRIQSADVLDNDTSTSKGSGKKNKTNNCAHEEWNNYEEESLYNGGMPDEFEESLPELTDDKDCEMKAMCELQRSVENIMRITRCEDEELVREILHNVGLDVDCAVELIRNISDNPGESSQGQSSAVNGIWSAGGTGTRIFGADGDSHIPPEDTYSNTGAKPKLKQMPASYRARAKKEEKKARAVERRRQERLGNTAPCGGLSSDEECCHLVTDNMGTLKI